MNSQSSSYRNTGGGRDWLKFTEFILFPTNDNKLRIRKLSNKASLSSSAANTLVLILDKAVSDKDKNLKIKMAPCPLLLWINSRHMLVRLGTFKFWLAMIDNLWTRKKNGFELEQVNYLWTSGFNFNSGISWIFGPVYK